jgi:hypothetical protein
MATISNAVNVGPINLHMSHYTKHIINLSELLDTEPTNHSAGLRKQKDCTDK